MMRSPLNSWLVEGSKLWKWSRGSEEEEWAVVTSVNLSGLSETGRVLRKVNGTGRKRKAQAGNAGRSLSDQICGGMVCKCLAD